MADKNFRCKLYGLNVNFNKFYFNKKKGAFPLWVVQCIAYRLK